MTATLIVSLFLLSLLGGTGAWAAAPTAASPAVASAGAWTLMDYQQKVCYVSTRGGTSYGGIWISGSWAHQVDIGASALPAGGSFYTFYAPIPPGSSDGVGSLAYVAIALPVGVVVGTYTASLWATDGSVTESVPITLVVNATSCRHY